MSSADELFPHAENALAFTTAHDVVAVRGHAASADATTLTSAEASFAVMTAFAVHEADAAEEPSPASSDDSLLHAMLLHAKTTRAAREAEAHGWRRSTSRRHVGQGALL